MHRLASRSLTRLVPGLVVAFVACSSSASKPPNLGAGGGAAPPVLDLDGAASPGGGTMMYRLDNSNGGVTQYVRATPDAVWKTLLVTYNDLNLPITGLDTSARQLSSSAARAPRTIGSKPLHDYLDCGSGISGPRVESYDVAYTLVSTVTPALGDSTAVQSSLIANATSRGGASSAPVACVTTGRLEQRLAQLVRLKLGR